MGYAEPLVSQRDTRGRDAQRRRFRSVGRRVRPHWASARVSRVRDLDAAVIRGRNTGEGLDSAPLGSLDTLGRAGCWHCYGHRDDGMAPVSGQRWLVRAWHLAVSRRACCDARGLLVGSPGDPEEVTVALTLEEEQRLANASLVKLFNKDRNLWKEMAEQAYGYTKTFVKRAGAEVRVDDVVGSLVSGLRVTTVLTDYLASKKLREKYWVAFFADFILEKLWGELGKGHSDG